MRVQGRHRVTFPRALVISTLAILLLGLSTAHGEGSPWTVDDDGPADFSTIQEAVDIASNGDTILVMPGSYTGTGDSDVPVVDMKGKSIDLQGLPEGNEGVYIDGEDIRRCLVCTSGEDSDTLIEAIECRNGTSNRGGGLYCIESSPTVTNCVFENNTSTDRGGAVYVELGNPTFNECTVINNSSAYGGGFYLRETIATIVGGSVSGNTATGRGGGFRIVDASPSVIDVQVESNVASRGGGASIRLNSVPLFLGCIIRKNAADSLGGGVEHVDSQAFYQYCTFVENEATGNNGGQGNGGAVHADNSTLLLEGCLLAGNTAVADGGGLYCLNSSPAIFSSTIQYNSAGSSGGGIMNIGSGSPTVMNSVLCDNSPTNIGGSWEDKGNNCIADSCDDEDVDGVIDACDDDIIPTLEVPNEYDTVQQAYDAAEEGNVILVHPGVHLVDDEGAPSQGLTMAGKNVTLRSVDGPDSTSLEKTISGRIMTCYDLSSNTLIDGFTIRGGASTAGGGIALSNTNAQVSNCIIESNHGVFGGGVSIGAGSDPTFTDSIIRDNTSSLNGAGIMVIVADATLIDCEISDNTTSSMGTMRGGGLHILVGAVRLEHCNVRFNTLEPLGSNAEPLGAGAFVSGGTLVVDDTEFTNNTAPNGAAGSGIYSVGASRVEFSRGTSVDAINTYGTGNQLVFTADSSCDVTSDIIPPEDGAMIMDIDDLDDWATLLCTGDILAQGCLTITNETGTLANAQLGDFIYLIETMSFSAGGGTAVFPPMPIGLGLQVTQLDDGQSRGNAINAGVEVIEVDTPDFNDPMLGDLDIPPVDMVALDVDNDGEEELAVLFDGMPGSLWIYDITESAAPVLITKDGIDAGNGPVGLDAGDLDGDGDDDLIIANAVGQQLLVLRTDSPDTFSVDTVPVPVGIPTCAAVIDWDGNGSLDAVVGVDVPGTSDDGFQVLLDVLAVPAPGDFFATTSYFNGLGNEPDPPTTVSGGGTMTGWGFTGGTRFGQAYHAKQGDTSLTGLASIDGQKITHIIAQDLDENGGDDLLDVVLASDEGELLFIIPGLPAGFDTPIPIMVAEPVQEFVALDVEGDGDTDLIITCPFTNNEPLLLLRNDEPGSSLRSLANRNWSKQILDSSGSTEHLASGTLDPKDEDDDWVIGGGAIGTLRGTSGHMEQTTFLPPDTPCPGDVNDDDIVSIDDLLVVIGNFGGSGKGDANEDGIVDIEDILIVLDAFGQGC